MWVWVVDNCIPSTLMTCPVWRAGRAMRTWQTDNTVQYRALNAKLPLNHRVNSPLQSPTSGHYRYRPVVTICTTSLTLTNSTFCPHSVFMCFVWIWQQTAIISLYSTDWLVFINETECVYCAVRSTFYVLPTQCIYVFCVDLRTNSDYFTMQHWLVGFYNWDGMCLLRGTDWVLGCRLSLVFKVFNHLDTNNMW